MEYGYHGDGTPKNEIWPVLMSKNELAMKTVSAYTRYLNSGVEILNRNDLINSSQNLAVALNGNSDDCYFIAENFGSDKWPENADPQLAFQWSAYRQLQLSIFDDGYTHSNALAVFNEAYYLVLFGTEAQKISAIQAMDACVQQIFFKISWDYFLIGKYISLLAGVHPEKVFRKAQYDYSSVVNKEYAIELYKKFMDLLISSRESNAEDYANELEPILGIQYYENQKGNKRSSTSGGSSSSNGKSGGCYVATCVYGSYDCPEVWTLRRFRDNILSKYVLGRLFIKVYYAISPRIVSAWGENESVRGVWKKPLDKLVGFLKNRGFEDTPYKD